MPAYQVKNKMLKQIKYPDKTVLSKIHFQKLDCEYQGDISSWVKDGYEYELKLLKNNRLSFKLFKSGIEPEDLFDSFKDINTLISDIIYWIKYNDSINVIWKNHITYKYNDKWYKIKNENEIKNTIEQIKNPNELILYTHATASCSLDAILIIRREIPKDIPNISSDYRKYLDEYFHLRELQEMNYDSRDEVFRKGYLLLKKIDTELHNNKFPNFTSELNKLTAVRNFLSHPKATKKETLNILRQEIGIVQTNSDGKEFAVFDRNNTKHMDLVGRQETVLLTRIRKIFDKECFGKT